MLCSNLFTTLGVALILTSIILLGYWRASIGVAGVVLVLAGWAAWRSEVNVPAESQRPASAVRSET